jgi:hypothetical protein
MIETSVYPDGCDFFVSINMAGQQIDTAGPFDDRLDAELAAQRIAPPRVELDDLAPLTQAENWESFYRSQEQRRDVRRARRSL